MVPVVDFGRSFCTQSALRFDTDDPAEVGVPGNVCRAQILATCAITRWPSEAAQVAAAGGGVQRGHTHTFHLCQPCIGEHMYKEALPEGVRYQLQEPTSEIYVVAQQRDAGYSGQEKSFADHRSGRDVLQFADPTTTQRTRGFRGDYSAPDEGSPRFDLRMVPGRPLPSVAALVAAAKNNEREDDPHRLGVERGAELPHALHQLEAGRHGIPGRPRRRTLP